MLRLLQSQPGKRERGTALLKTSLELAEALGMKALIARIKESEAIGGAVSTVAQRSPDAICPGCALFLDIIDSAKLSKDVGDRAWRDLLHRIHGIAHQHIRRLGAIELEEHQDGLIAIFSMPSIAVSAASAISDSVARFKVSTKAAIYAPQQGVTITEARGLFDQSRSKLFSKASPGEIVLWSTSSTPVIDQTIQPIGSDTLDIHDSDQSPLYFFRVELGDQSGSRKVHEK